MYPPKQFHLFITCIKTVDVFDKGKLYYVQIVKRTHPYPKGSFSVIEVKSGEGFRIDELEEFFEYFVF